MAYRHPKCSHSNRHPELQESALDLSRKKNKNRWFERKVCTSGRKRKDGKEGGRGKWAAKVSASAPLQEGGRECGKWGREGGWVGKLRFCSEYSLDSLLQRDLIVAYL